MRACLAHLLRQLHSVTSAARVCAALYLLAAGPAQAQVLYTQSFESGTLPPEWSTPTDLPFATGNWFVTNLTAGDGSFSIQSPTLLRFETSRIVLTLTTPYARLDFQHFWNTQVGEPIQVYVNGQLEYSNSNAPRGWFPAFVNLPSGTNEIEFRYGRAIRGGTACNCVRIDDIVVTSRDADLDDMPDEWELDNGFNPADPNDATLDADGDGLLNRAEFEQGTDPNDPDSDGDTVSDGDEVNVNATNPLAPDSDLDELPDGWEIGNGLNPLDPADADLDADGDGLSNTGEFRLGFDPQDPLSVPAPTIDYLEDFEGGAVPALWQPVAAADAGWEITDITANTGAFSLVNANIADNDVAAILLPLFVEESELTFSHYWNAEFGDALIVRLNGAVVYQRNSAPRGWIPIPAPIDIPAGYNEIEFIFDKDFSLSQACDCVRIDDIRVLTKDKDQDGILDEWELEFGLDPNDPSDAALDGDSDGLTNLEEFQNGTRPNDDDSDNDSLLDGDEINTFGTSPLSRDSDMDRLPDGYEVVNGLDPLNELDAELDSDGDGLSNFGEFSLGTDPQDPGSVPALTTSFTEDFEAGVYPANFSTPPDADAGWSITSVTANGGSAFSLESDNITDAETAAFSFQVFTPLAELNFQYFWNALRQDAVRVYVNGELLFADIEAPRGWFPSPTIPLDAGYNDIRFEFAKNFSGSGACDCVRVDDITIVSIDADLDGQSDQWELDNGLDPNDPSDAALDNDTDGLSNLGEFLAQTDPNNDDSDADGLLDGTEVNAALTDPNNPDTDGDALPDAWEFNNGLDANDPGDVDQDADGDGLSNRGEFRLSYNPQDPGSVPPPLNNFIDTFETGGLATFAWRTPEGADQGWAVTTADANEGVFSAQGSRSGLSSFGDTAELMLTLYTTAPTLRLSYQRDGRNNGDPFKILLNRTEILRVDDNTDWTVLEIPLATGYNEVVFQFERRISTPQSGSCNCARIDTVIVSGDDIDGDLIADWYELLNGLNPTVPGDALLDRDGDGLNNLGEFNAGTDLDEVDTDGDGLDDNEELNTLFTDPLAVDSDMDGMPDGWEVANGLNPLSELDADTDADGDSLSNLGEFRTGFDPNDPFSLPPTDSGYSENFEGGVRPARFFVPVGVDAGWDITSATANSGSFSLQSENITDNETAAIVLPLFAEASQLNFSYYWNARIFDRFRVFVNDELVLDPRGTELPRGWFPSPGIPLAAGYNEVRFEFVKDAFGSQACDCVRIDDLVLTTRDADLDGIEDGFELDNGLNPADPSDALLDADGDGLNNVTEFQLTTDLFEPDTDGDGATDGAEFNTLGTDPLDNDTDDDGLDDGWEADNGLNPLLAGDQLLDPDGDGLNSLGEFRLGTDPQDIGSVAPQLSSYVEGFESGLFPAGPRWQIPTDAEFTFEITDITANSGIYSLVNENVADNDVAQVRWQAFTTDTLFSFRHYWNALGNDRLRVSVNGAVVYATNANTPRGWIPGPILPLSAGYNEVLFEFIKDANGTAACDCVRIDDIELIAN